MASRSGGSEFTVAHRFCRANRGNHLCRHHRTPRPRALALRRRIDPHHRPGLPDDPALRTAYIHGLHKIGVTAVGFGTGLTFDTVPPELIAAADDCGLALFEVPLATLFVAVAKTVMNRLAHQQYESVLTATRVQTRMTRAAAVSGAPGTLGELSSACGGPAIIIDRTGKVIHAARGRDTDDQNEAIAAGIGHLITRAAAARSRTAASSRSPAARWPWCRPSGSAPAPTATSRSA